MPLMPPNQQRQSTEGSFSHQVTNTPFNGPFSGTTQESQYQKGKTNLDFTGARDSEWQWHQLGHMQVCISIQTDNHTSTPPLSFLTGQVKSVKTEKLKSKKRICSEVTVNSMGNPCSQCRRRKEGEGGKDLQKSKVLSLE